MKFFNIKKSNAKSTTWAFRKCRARYTNLTRVEQTQNVNHDREISSLLESTEWILSALVSKRTVSQRNTNGGIVLTKRELKKEIEDGI